MAEVFVTQAEFARQIGRDRSLVSRLIKKGVIPVSKDRKVPLEEGKRILEARRAANLTVEMIQSATAAKAPAKTKAASRTVAQVDDSNESEDVLHELNLAKRDLTKAQARLKEFEQLEREGQLVETAVVEQEGAALGALVREWMSSAPSRYSGYLEMKTQREAELELKQMMQDLNKFFQSSQYTREVEQ